MNRKELGRIGEDAAVRFAAGKGLRILARNWRFSRMGEVDIIAQEGDTLCFIEVKARSGNLYGSPAEAVSPAKRKTITSLARIYMQQNNVHDRPVRFDVIEVFLRSDHGISSISHIKNAF
jgi:putative endonuclease